ncbi:MAG TPA: Hsp20/alpha crystallin family protein [Candidatus Sumerlaeota bacterium]|nr:MAG: Spore protein SP21 [candidate division BRC1 bacterium ADurb.BinA292]HOE95755.1 Hsp20/alpha crystallin family protein [Candidatus Sumerlaeota bacterium]HOR26514.1 Hsp20/alpha crystallin family protein [Candidatus Sumerlaeota bacterium]HPK02170.1 Hsp20/alpha crystallin family protein [Candidatus Sumerlaeota bacterium]
MGYQSMLDNFFSSQRPLFSLSQRVWNPPTDIYETEEAAIIRMEVAGLDENQLNIITQGELLIVRGRRDRQLPHRKINYHLMEVHYGGFERLFAFSFPLDEKKIKATYERGFLTIEVPRQAPQVTEVSVRIIEEAGPR